MVTAIVPMCKVESAKAHGAGDDESLVADCDSDPPPQHEDRSPGS
jgi:hypothetical protein